MVCISASAPPATIPTVSNIIYAWGADSGTQKFITIEWDQDIAGNIKVEVDSVVILQGLMGSGHNTTSKVVSKASHNICVYGY